MAASGRKWQIIWRSSWLVFQDRSWMACCRSFLWAPGSRHNASAHPSLSSQAREPPSLSPKPLQASVARGLWLPTFGGAEGSYRAPESQEPSDDQKPESLAGRVLPKPVRDRHLLRRLGRRQHHPQGNLRDLGVEGTLQKGCLRQGLDDLRFGLCLDAKSA